MIKRLSLFLLLTMVISWTPITAQETPGPIGVLQVVDSDPLIGSELGAQQPITVYFDRDLACETVDPSVSLTPAIEGAITCDGTALTFTPDQPYQLDTRYTLTLDADRLRGQDGAALTNDVSLEFLAAGVLRVTSTLPGNDSVDVTADSPLTIVFNRPVVPLGVVSDSPDLPTPITIDPPIEGTGEWLNTAIYLFRPAIAWGGGQTYTVTVDDVRGVDGAPLGQPYTFSFTVALPVVLETIPGFDALGIRLKPTIQVTFNQPIDQASLEANFYLRPFNADSGTVSGTFEWNEDRTGFGFTPDSNLRLDTTYLFGFPAFEVKALVGEATLAAFESGFTTVPLPRIVSTDPSDGTLARPYGGFRLIFASPMNPETLPDKIVINPAPVVPPTFFYQEWNDSYSVEFSAEPSTTYNITINPGAEDIYGNTIRDVYTFSYTTMAYDAELNLVAPVGPVGFYDAGRETTGLFITHRNVSQLDLQLYVVPEADFIGALTLGEYYALTSNYAPRAQNLVKSWTIPSVAPENVLRYELLDLAAPSNNAATSPTEPVVCEGALSPRAKIGDQARVIVTPDPLRARATPPDGEIVDLLYADYSFLILDGPICANNIYWWQISLRDGDTAWVAEGLGEEYFFEVTVSGPEITPITPAIQLDGGALPPGIYLLGVSADETQELGYSEQRHFLVVGTANLTMKSSVNEVLVWATDVRTGQPLTGVPISLYGVDQIAIAATTDEQGVARFTIERSPDLYQPLTVVLNDGENFGISFIEWDDGVDPWRFDIGYNFYPDQYRTYLYTERSVYRPGQPIYFRAIVREKDGLSYPVPDFEEVTIRLFDNQGTVVFEDQFALTEFGTVSGQIPLSIDARLGGYNLSIELPVETQYGRITNSIFFDVAEYRLPEYQVTLTPEQPEVLQGEMVRVTVDTEFYFGGPVFDATVDYQIFRYATIFDYEGRGFYNFFDFNEDTDDPTRRNPFYEEQIATGTLRTDVNGQAVIEIPAELGDFNFSQILNIQASVTDSSGQTVSGRTEVIVHQAEVYLGIAPERYVGTAGTAQAFNLITVDWESQPIANQEIQIEVVERRWSNVQTLDPATGRLTYDSEVEEIPVSSGIVTTDADGTARYEFVPPNGGIFKAIATVTDTNGYTARSSTTMWVSGGEYVQWRVDNNNRIELIADQEDYQIGDTAEVLITSPYQGAVEALITIEQGDVLRYERITLEGNSYTYRVPITEDFAPNVFVGVFLAKGVDETNPVASFRVGYVQLNVDNSRKALTIALEADRPLAGPRDTITYTVRTTDYTGEPVAAELGISLVDLAVLSLGNEFSQPSPLLEVFYGRELLGVRTSTPLTINTDYLTQFVLDVIKGGGGGGGGGGVFVIREEFVE
nr:Ig-like domain-containing protein [Anaerolineae bacterium]